MVLILRVDTAGNVYVLAENYEVERDTGEVADDLLRRWPILSKIRTIYLDPAEPDDAPRLKKKWRVERLRNTGGELKTRLELIRTPKAVSGAYPLDAAGRHQAGRGLIDPACVNLNREMRDYRYPQTARGEPKEPADEPLDATHQRPEARRVLPWIFRQDRAPNRPTRARIWDLAATQPEDVDAWRRSERG